MSVSDPPKSRTLSDLAARLDAQLVGDGAYSIEAVDQPATASEEHVLALAMTPETFSALQTTKAHAVIVSEGCEIDLNKFAGGLVIKRHRYALALLQDLFSKPVHSVDGIHPSAAVDSTAQVADDVSIGAFVYVGPGAQISAGCKILPHSTIGSEARIGANCVIHAGTRIGDRVVVGENVIIQPNATIGADGFSFVTPEEGSIEVARSTGKAERKNQNIARINSTGTVIIGDDVEIGAGTHVDRATLGATTIGRGTKIDNLVQIAHNCAVGEDCLIAGHTGISGSVVLGDRVVLAGGVGIADHVKVGNDTIIGAGSGIGVDIPEKSFYVGYPAKPMDQAAEGVKNIARLRRIIPDVISLKARVSQLEKKE